MGNLYFVRHGQTIWNVENKICGATDIALTELGHEQAIETGKKILEMGIKADEIRYSHLSGRRIPRCTLLRSPASMQLKNRV